MPPAPLDLSLLAAGRHERVWRFLGAHPAPGGTSFAVWAPRAREIRVVVGRRGTLMTRLGDSGVWYAFVPGARPGQRYRYRIRGADGRWRSKADPVGVAADGRHSVIYASDHAWGDAAWCRPTDGPMSVYEVHLGSWRPGLSYVELAERLADHATGFGFTHVELLPVMEHPYGGSWGYQVTGFYAPTARFGTPDDFRYLVDHLHRHGIGVILDWVPAHFARDDWALARFDGAPLYEPADPARAEHPDWGSLIFDYARPEVRSFLISDAVYWCEEFHVDGLRVDAVASMLYLDYSRASGTWRPNVDGGNENLEAIEFLHELTGTVGRLCPGVALIAEESTSWPGVTRPADRGGLGFALKWNLGWMHDTLTALSREPADRDRLALPGTYAAAERWLLPLSHDEVVHEKRSLVGKLPGGRVERVAGLRGLLGYMWAFPGRKLIFMGTELAPETEWSEEQGLDWSGLGTPLVDGVCQLITDLNRVYRAEPALWSQDDDPAGFRWLALDDTAAALLRRGVDGSLFASVTNLSGTRLRDFRLPVPHAGRWAEVINTDAVDYAGTGVGNLGEVVATGSPAGAYVQVGPHATVWLKYAG